MSSKEMNVFERQVVESGDVGKGFHVEVCDSGAYEVSMVDSRDVGSVSFNAPTILEAVTKMLEYNEPTWLETHIEETEKGCPDDNP